MPAMGRSLGNKSVELKYGRPGFRPIRSKSPLIQEMIEESLDDLNGGYIALERLNLILDASRRRTGYFDVSQDNVGLIRDEEAIDNKNNV